VAKELQPKTLLLAVIPAAGIITVVALRIPAATADIHAALARTSAERLPWLGAAVAAEVVSLACAAAAQRRLLAAGGASLPGRAMFGLALGSTGLGRLLPAGPATATAWLTGQYRRRGIDGTLGLWAVLSGGFAASVTLLALLLAGAAVAGLASPALLATAAVILAAGSAGVIAAAHRLPAVTGWLAGRHPGTRAARTLAATASLARLRAGYRRGTAALLFTTMTRHAEAAVLAAAFELAGWPVPWHSLLLAHTASQLAGSLIPLPGGLGGADAGLLGALTLTGTPLAAAAAVTYPAIGYWVVGAAATYAAAAMGRRHRRLTSRTRPEGQQPDE
jgi:putative heme transporter